jgi:hypothetical protein
VSVSVTSIGSERVSDDVNLLWTQILLMVVMTTSEAVSAPDQIKLN